VPRRSLPDKSAGGLAQRSPLAAGARADHPWLSLDRRSLAVIDVLPTNGPRRRAAPRVAADRPEERGVPFDPFGGAGSLC